MMKGNVKKRWALILILALVMGLLSVDQTWVKAEESSASAEKSSASAEEMSALADAQADYGLQNPRTDEEGDTTWDCIWFGNYLQEDTNGDKTVDENDDKTPIKWRVLSVDGDDAFLLADKCLDCQVYNTMRVYNITWETCTVRSWLNGYGEDKNTEGVDYSVNNFINAAFIPLEQAAIRDTMVVNEDNLMYDYGTPGGNNTTDKIYFLSLNEVMNPKYGFPTTSTAHKTRQAQNTTYAKLCGASPVSATGYAEYPNWWLRSPGHCSHDASDIAYSGSVKATGSVIDYDVLAVRPVLHLDLSSASVWSKAGTLSSTGEVSEKPPVSTETPSEEITPTPVVTPTPDITASPTTPPVSTETPSEDVPTPVVTPTPVITASPTIPPVSTETPVASQTPVLTASETPVPDKTPSPDKDLSTIVEGLGVSEDTAAKIQAAAKELNVSQDTILVTEQMIQSQKTDDDIKGSYFARLQARASQITQKNIKLSWNRVKGADGYEVYGNRCNTKKWIYEYKKMKTIENGNKKSFIDRNCKKGTYYKYIVRAYKIIDGKKVTIAASKTIHVTTTGGKNGNAKSVKVNKTKVSLKAGKGIKLKSSEVKESKPLRHHREVSYESSAPDVATVSKEGRIKAKKKGKCIIFAYAQSGIFRKIKVTVK